MTINQNSKGFKVLELFAAAYPVGTSRKKAADEVGCTVQRVGEVVRQAGSLVLPGQAGYTIPPDSWKAFVNGLPVKVVQDAQEVLDDQARTTKTAKAKHLALVIEPKVNYDAVMAALAAGESAGDTEFLAARTFAKAKKRKAPRR